MHKHTRTPYWRHESKGEHSILFMLSPIFFLAKIWLEKPRCMLHSQWARCVCCKAHVYIRILFWQWALIWINVQMCISLTIYVSEHRRFGCVPIACMYACAVWQTTATTLPIAEGGKQRKSSSINNEFWMAVFFVKCVNGWAEGVFVVGEIGCPCTTIYAI